LKKFAGLQKIFEQIDKQNFHQIVVDTTRVDWIKDEANFCLSPNWMSWPHTRLIEVIIMYYDHLRRAGGAPGGERAEHDYQDMEYVLLLSRADGLLTGDKFIKALAKAAFPEKDVFKNLDEVPVDYLR